jgi:hypothetical protein
MRILPLLAVAALTLTALPASAQTLTAVVSVERQPVSGWAQFPQPQLGLSR